MIQRHERPKFIFLIPLEAGVSMNEIQRAVRAGWNDGEIGTGARMRYRIITRR